MVRFSLRTLMVITAAVAVTSSIVIAFRPRDLRSEIEEIAKTSTPFNRLDLVGDFSMLKERLQLNSDGTYCLTMYSGCFGDSFVDTGKWSLHGNLIDFSVNPSSTNSLMRWAYATFQNGKLAIIPDCFAEWYIDRGEAMSLSFGSTIVQTAIEEGEQTDGHEAADRPH